MKGSLILQGEKKALVRLQTLRKEVGEQREKRIEVVGGRSDEGVGVSLSLDQSQEREIGQERGKAGGEDLPLSPLFLLTED